MTVTIKLLNAADSDEVADISSIALERTLRVRHNMARSFELTAPAGNTLLTATYGDDLPNLRRGVRKIVVWEDGDVIFHGRVFLAERTGDGTENLVKVTAFDPWMELGFDADDRAGRPVRDTTGNFITPDFGDDPISGPELAQQILQTSEGTDAEGGAHPGEGPLPIDLVSGDFDAYPDAVDLNPTRLMSWPILCGDFLTELVATGAVDIRMRPLDPADALDPLHMVELSAKSVIGVDRHASVHFDYWTGSHNAAQCRHVEDFSTINNKLYDYLGPPLTGGERFPAGNITPTLADSILTGLGDRINDSRERYGVFMQIRIVDTDSQDVLADANRPLFKQAWAAEQSYRVEPRDMLFITPTPGSFDAPGDFDIGDLITVNVGSDFGLAIAETQRVYGYDKTWSRENVTQLAELLVSADPA